MKPATRSHTGHRLTSVFVAVVFALAGIVGGVAPTSADTGSTATASARTTPVPTASVTTAGTNSVTTPPLSITDTDSPDPVTSGTRLTYTIVLTNTGGAQVSGVQITDQFNGLGPDTNNPPNLPLTITSSAGSCSQSAYKVTCSAPTLAGGQSLTVTVRGIVTAAGGTTLNNTANGTATKSAQTFNASDTASPPGPATRTR
jgi:hypothetical protein